MQKAAAPISEQKHPQTPAIEPEPTAPVNPSPVNVEPAVVDDGGEVYQFMGTESDFLRAFNL